MMEDLISSQEDVVSDGTWQLLTGSEVGMISDAFPSSWGMIVFLWVTTFQAQIVEVAL